MEIKCDICGTINDGSTNFCKGCFQKLNAERKQNIVSEEKITNVIESEKERDIPWNNDELDETPIENSVPEIDDWEMESVNDDTKIEEVDESSKDNQPVETGALPVDSDEEEINNPALPEDEQINTTNENEEESTSDIEPVDEDINSDELENTEDVKEESLSEDISVNSNELEDNALEEIIEPIAELEEEDTKSEDIVDDWSSDPVETEENNKKEPKFILKFALIYILSMIIIFGILIMTIKYLNNVFDNETSDIVSFAIYRLAALCTLLIATKLTFKAQVPKIDDLNKVTFKILGFIAIPSILIQLFVLGFIKNTKVLMFIVGAMLSLIILVIFFSYIRNIIKRKSNENIDDKVFFVYGIINIILIIGLLGFGFYARGNNLNMPKINFLYSLFNDTKADKEVIQKFINQVQLNILEYQVEYENYVLPSKIDDVNYAAYDEYVPDEIDLKLNNEGAILNGTIKYHGITYHYDGEKIKVK